VKYVDEVAESRTKQKRDGNEHLNMEMRESCTNTSGLGAGGGLTLLAMEAAMSLSVPVEACSVTVVLKGCYRSVTVVLQWCYSGVTVVSQWCYCGITFRGQACVDALLLPPGCLCIFGLCSRPLVCQCSHERAGLTITLCRLGIYTVGQLCCKL
jgi:hypothetical protein